jgi:hypothetical protein
VVVNDLTEWPALPAELLARFGVSALVGTPLFLHGRILGTFVAFSTGRGRFDWPGAGELVEL